MKKELRRMGAALAAITALSCAACTTGGDTAPAEPVTETATPTEAPAAAEPTEAPAEVTPEETPAEKNGDVYILFTSDVHCGIDKGFGYVGLQQLRDSLEAEGYTTLLVDNGDAIQGEALGTLSKGEVIVELMNDLKYDVAIPGNHEFDYGMDRFLELAEKAEYPYISCNFNKMGELVFEPYVIKEAAGKKIGFVGVTTPRTLVSSTPAYFMNDRGEYVYGFFQDENGESVYEAVQSAVDAARADGADLVYVMGHMGMESDCEPWTYADIIANTSGIDVFLDGHSHDSEQLVMKNKDGEDVTRSACGTKLNSVGYSHISAEGEILETGIWSWPNSDSMPRLMSLENSMSGPVSDALKQADESLKTVVASAAVELTINDPVEKDESGKPIRMIRRAETNLGDLCADAIRDQTGAEVAIMNGGGIRVSMEKGDITYGDIISVHPFGNQLCILEVTGQQILDALEWGAKTVPDESGGFLQVSGMSYTIDVSVPSPCKIDENGLCAGFSGKRRVSNVMIGDAPLDPKMSYTLGGINYTLLNHGDGTTAFDGATVLAEEVKLDNQALIDYIVDSLGGEIGEDYADPYGEGRIEILDSETE